jgi:hypothetical protein
MICEIRRKVREMKVFIGRSIGMVLTVGIAVFAWADPTGLGPCKNRDAGSCATIACDSIHRQNGTMNCDYLGNCFIKGCFKGPCNTDSQRDSYSKVWRTEWYCTYQGEDDQPGERTCYGGVNQPPTQELSCCDCPTGTGVGSGE